MRAAARKGCAPYPIKRAGEGHFPPRAFGFGREGILAAEAEKQALRTEEEAELNRLWRKLVKLDHPDRFAREPDKLTEETRELSGTEISRIGWARAFDGTSPRRAPQSGEGEWSSAGLTLC